MPGPIRPQQPSVFDPTTLNRVYQVEVDGAVGQYFNLSSAQRRALPKPKTDIPVTVKTEQSTFEATYSPRGASSLFDRAIPKGELHFKKNDVGTDPLVTPGRQLRLFSSMASIGMELPPGREAEAAAFMKHSTEQEYLLNNMLSALGLEGFQSRLAQVHYVDPVGAVDRSELEILVEDVADVGGRLGGVAVKHGPSTRYSEEDLAAMKLFGAFFVDYDFNFGEVAVGGRAIPLLSDFDRGAFASGSPTVEYLGPDFPAERARMIDEVRTQFPPEVFARVRDRFIAAKPELERIINASAVSPEMVTFAKTFIAQAVEQLVATR